jgi:hypothetical protein
MLTPKDRKKLTGEQDVTELQNISDWKGKVQQSIAATYEDMALLDASPYWDDEDFAKVFRDKHRNTGLFSRMSETGIDTGSGAVEAQTKIYGDSVNNFANNLRDLDIDGSWQESENVEQEVQEMFVRNVANVITDVLHLVGVTDDDVVREFFEDVWPKKEEALKIIGKELSDG